MSLVNYNLAYNTNYKLEIIDAPELNYFVQSTNIPGISIGEIPTPHRNTNVYLPDNRVEFEELSVEFLVNESVDNWQYLFEWIKTITTKSPIQQFRDIKLHILNNNKIQSKVITFTGAFPTMLASIPLESAVGDNTAIMCNVSFRYQYYEFI